MNRLALALLGLVVVALLGCAASPEENIVATSHEV
jgi:hypothetical protein